MKRFRFNLRSVATVRALAEMRAREALMKAVRECELLGPALEEQRACVARFSEEMRQPGQTGIRGETQTALLRAYRAEIEAEAAAERAFATAVALRETSRTRWIDAFVRCDQMGDLRARARAKHEADSARHEQHQLDDRMLRHTNLSSA